MKLIRRILLIAVFSLAIAGLFYYLTDGVVKSASLGEKLAEIGTVAIIIFVLMLIAYIIAKSVVKGAMAVRKKKAFRKGRP